MSTQALIGFVASLGFAVLLIALNAFFVVAELAIVKVRDAQLEALAARGSRAARRALALKRNLSKVIAGTQVGITIVALVIGNYIEDPAKSAASSILLWLRVQPQPWIEKTLALIAFAIVTFVLIIFGEILPKAIAIQRTLPMAVGISTPMVFFLKLVQPAIWLIETIASWLLKRLGLPADGEDDGPYGEAELRLLFLRSHASRAEAPHPSGSTSTPLARDIVLNSLDLRRRLVRDVMRPRREIVALNTAAPIAECVRLAERTRYSRFPVAQDGNLDKTWGVIHFKDLIAQRDRVGTGADLRGYARPLIFVPPTARLEKVLTLFLERRSHFALVVDEYGGTIGCITLENALEELVGQIQDEFDHEKPRIVAKAEGHWEIDGMLPLFELEELTGTHLESDEGTTTVNGWITREQGGFPRVGDKRPMGDYEIEVEEIDHLRVSRLALRRINTPAPPGAEKD